LFSPGTLVSSTNKTDCHDITEILLKVVLNTINQHDRYSADKQWGEGGTYIDKNDDDIDKDSTTAGLTLLF
jgi:hypothetical protein